MHKNYQKADRLSKLVIGAAIEVHRIMGPGLIELVDAPLGILINFQNTMLKHGLNRLIIPGADGSRADLERSH